MQVVNNNNTKKTPGTEKEFWSPHRIDLEGYKENRKLRRLVLLGSALKYVMGGFIASTALICLMVMLGHGTPPAIIVLNTVLASTLTTIVGVIAGTTID